MSAANTTFPPPTASVEALPTAHQYLPASPPPASSTATLPPSGASGPAASRGLAAPLGLANGGSNTGSRSRHALPTASGGSGQATPVGLAAAQPPAEGVSS